MKDDEPLVAVVDDEESIRRALVRLLRAGHYRAEAFSCGGAFLASLADHVPSCVILDLQMPLMTGLDVQQRLRDAGIELPVIIITAHDEPGTRERSLALGASHYFCKPIDAGVLMAAVQGVVTCT